MDNFWLMELLALPALNDNYVWLLHDGRQTLAVDLVCGSSVGSAQSWSARGSMPNSRAICPLKLL